MLGFFQIMTLDNWVELAAQITEENGNRWFMCLFFIVFISVSALALMNLVTAVVVDSATRRTNELEDVRRSAQLHQVQLIKTQVFYFFFGFSFWIFFLWIFLFFGFPSRLEQPDERRSRTLSCFFLFFFYCPGDLLWIFVLIYLFGLGASADHRDAILLDLFFGTFFFWFFFESATTAVLIPLREASRSKDLVVLLPPFSN